MEGSSFPSLVLPADMVDSKSVVDIKLGYSSVIVGYQDDKVIYTWLAECLLLDHIFAADSQSVNFSLLHTGTGIVRNIPCLTKLSNI